MKNLKIYEEFVNEGDKYDDFMKHIKSLPEEQKEFLSNTWMDSDEVTSTIASALWTSMRTGSSFKTVALKFLDKIGVMVNGQSALDDFINQHG